MYKEKVFLFHLEIQQVQQVGELHMCTRTLV